MIHTKIDQIESIHSNIRTKTSIHSKLESKGSINSKVGLPTIVEQQVDIYEGPTTVVPSSYFDQELYTKNKLVKSDITVKQIPFYETTNETGKTIYIGNEDLVIFEGGN